MNRAVPLLPTILLHDVYSDKDPFIYLPRPSEHETERLAVAPERSFRTTEGVVELSTRSKSLQT